LKRLQGLLMMLDGVFQLFNVLGPPFAECGLGLTVALFALLRRSIDLDTVRFVRFRSPTAVQQNKVAIYTRD
jgi:hypothetical protein